MKGLTINTVPFFKKIFDLEWNRNLMECMPFVIL